MRFLHTSDLHLGHELHGFSRALEHEVFLDWLVETLKARQVDVLLITGDIFDTTQASNAALKCFNDFLGRLDRELPRLQSVFIGGNHDSPARVELPRPFLTDKRCHLIGGLPRREGQPDLDACLIPLRDEQEKVAAYCLALPYLRPGDLPQISAAEETGSPDGALAALYKNAIDLARQKAAGVPLIATGHLNMSGGQLSEQSERRIVIGGEEAHSSSLFSEDLAYVALGHLHRPQQIKGPSLIRYSGTPFPMSMAEKDYRHSVVLVDVEAGQDSQVELLETPRAVDFLRVPQGAAGDLAAVLAELEDLPFYDGPAETQPFLEVVVTLDAPEPQLRARVEAALAEKGYRLVRIERRVGGAARGLGHGASVVRELSDYSPQEVFKARYQQVYDQSPEPALLAAFEEVLQSVQSPEETETNEGEQGAELGFVKSEIAETPPEASDRLPADSPSKTGPAETPSSETAVAVPGEEKVTEQGQLL
ncbi:exonuclease SbcCD subunit D C-terminal domain-containing protein [Rhodovibrionaceae bacterium A322]